MSIFNRLYAAAHWLPRGTVIDPASSGVTTVTARREADSPAC